DSSISFTPPVMFTKAVLICPTSPSRQWRAEYVFCCLKPSGSFLDASIPRQVRCKPMRLSWPRPTTCWMIWAGWYSRPGAKSLLCQHNVCRWIPDWRRYIGFRIGYRTFMVNVPNNEEGRYMRPSFYWGKLYERVFVVGLNLQ